MILLWKHGAGLLRACQTPLLTNEEEAGSVRLAPR